MLLARIGFRWWRVPFKTLYASEVVCPDGMQLKLEVLLLITWDTYYEYADLCLLKDLI